MEAKVLGKELLGLHTVLYPGVINLDRTVV